MKQSTISHAMRGENKNPRALLQQIAIEAVQDLAAQMPNETSAALPVALQQYIGEGEAYLRRVNASQEFFHPEFVTSVALSGWFKKLGMNILEKDSGLGLLSLHVMLRYFPDYADYYATGGAFPVGLNSLRLNSPCYL